ncbi:tyrosine-type recombinase/integrase [Natrinema halophilum]|uniref:tyrosine-type recombinase/integrase n=1 Tax=Natrinema halophilum TaxID=1699371 RepID=UPI001F321373|nr:site-specific integrase [Natrinema halophilum]UHQ96227.1 site-specific integrase [Natrinema halophilum]
MSSDGFDPEQETPAYAWLSNHYRGFVAHLSRNFDLSPGDFYDEISVPPVSEDGSGSFEFVEDDTTRKEIESYLVELRERQGRAESTVATRRSVLRRYVKLYREVNGMDDLLSSLRSEQGSSEEKARVADAFDALRQLDVALNTHASRLKYVQEVRQFYQHRVDFGKADYDPTRRLERRFGWDSAPEWDNSALNAEQIHALYRAAELPEDRLLVIGVCGWGLRPSEICALHSNQLTLSPEDEEDLEGADPYISFDQDERKNGPGTVALLVGIEELKSRIDQLYREYGEDWNGYILPSLSSKSGYISTETARRHFRNLAEDAGISVDGETPTPKMGRRYWYTAYGEAVKRVADRFKDIAEEQGSRSADVVLDNYLSESERRRHRRDEMQADLVGLFEPSDNSSRI